jgi:hypothetical protein
VVDEGASLIGHVQVGPDAAKGSRSSGPAPIAANRPVPGPNPGNPANQPK